MGRMLNIFYLSLVQLNSNKQYNCAKLQNSAGGCENGLIGEWPDEREDHGVGKRGDGLGCAGREREDDAGSEYKKQHCRV